MSSFVIKLIAVICMIFDHASNTIIGHISFFNIIGRIAFPLFCFQIVLGYKHTKNIKKYLIRLLIFGIISQIPFSLYTYSIIGTYTTLNVFFTLFLGLLAIIFFDKITNKPLAFLIDIIIIITAQLLNVDYGWFGICLILSIFILFKTNTLNNFFYNIKNNLLFILVYFTLCFIQFIPHFFLTYNYIVWAEIIGTFFPITFMLLYNGKKGKNLKYLFYTFYPIHLIVLLFI